MANNPYVNKVQYGNDTLIDLTNDTVTADKILQGYTAHDKSGAGITGTYVAPAEPTSITPSNVTPPVLTANVPVKPASNGYAIENYNSITPSADGQYFASGFNKMTSSGYAYSEKLKIKTGSSNYNGTNEVTINLGFKPKYLAICAGDTTNRMMNIYNEDVSTTQFMRAYGNSVGAWVNIGSTNYAIKSITNTGFSVVGYSGVNASFNYFAIG